MSCNSPVLEKPCRHLASLTRDVRFGARSLRRVPVLSTAAVVSIALGIAATVSVFSIVDAALFRPPPLEAPGQLAIAYITRQPPGGPVGLERWSWARSRLLQRRASSFAHAATFSISVLALTSGEPEPVNAEMVSSSYWATLRVHPQLGRAFTADEDAGTAAAAGTHAVAMIADDLWRRRYGGDTAIVGKTIAINGVPLTVIGVAPAGFSGLTGRAQAWIPATVAPRLSYAGYLSTNQNFISVIARLRDGVTIGQANAELAVVGQAIQRETPSASSLPNTRFAATAVSLAEARIDPTTRRPMLLLLAAVGCLLLLSCINVAGLLLGHGVSRRREIAIRVATGASRGRVIRQLLVEALLLAAAGGTLGVLIAIPVTSRLALPPAASSGRNFFSALGEFAAPQIDLRVVSFCLVLCAVTTLGFGLLPALRVTRVDLARDLKASSGAGNVSPGGVTARQLIVGAETLLAVLLLFCGGVLLSSWRRLSATDVGFDRANLMTFTIRPSEVQYPPARAPLMIARVLAELQRVPGVDAASVDGCTPVAPACASSTLFILGRVQPKPDDAPPVLRHYVGPDHFRALRVPVIRGRAFNDGDRAGANRVTIISEGAARRFWPNDDPIGKRVWFGGGSSFDRPDSSAEIVGIVGDVAYQHLDEHPFQADFYTPYAQFTYATRTVLVRTRGNANAIVPELRRAVRRADPNLALFDVRTMDDRVADSWARVTYQIRLLGAFAVVALLLAGTGIFAVISQVIGDRRHEIGVRTALGATPLQVIAIVGDRGARPAFAGVVLGLGVSLSIGRLLGASVYGVRAADPTLIACVTVTAAVVILLAVYLAARRALVIQPAEALRYQ